MPERNPEWLEGDAVAGLVLDTLVGRGLEREEALEAMEERYGYEPFGRWVDYIEGTRDDW